MGPFLLGKVNEMDDYWGLGPWESTETNHESPEAESSGALAIGQKFKLARNVRSVVGAMARGARRKQRRPHDAEEGER